MTRPGRAGFGYAIDYAAAIAVDLRIIARCELALAKGWLKPATTRPGYGCRMQDLVAQDEAVATALGLTSDDRAALAIAFPCGDSGRRADAAMRVINAAWPDGAMLDTEEEARARLKKAKASLARHRRNQGTFGGQ